MFVLFHAKSPPLATIPVYFTLNGTRLGSAAIPRQSGDIDEAVIAFRVVLQLD